MNWLDIIILVVLVAAVFTGLRRGIIKAALSLAGLIIGVVLAGRYYAALAEELTLVPEGNIAHAVAFVIILVGVMLAAGLLASVLAWVTSLSMLGWIDRVGGAIFGLVLGQIVSAALLTLWVNFLGMADIIQESSLAGMLLDRFPAILDLLPAEFEAIRSFFE